MYRTAGVGPITVMRTAPVDLSQVELLRQQALMTQDPATRQRLMFRAALEQQYAEQAAQAQQGVQDAALSPGGDIIQGSAGQSAAKSRRSRLLDKAAQAYNSALPAGEAFGRRKQTGINPFKGA